MKLAFVLLFSVALGAQVSAGHFLQQSEENTVAASAGDVHALQREKRCFFGGCGLGVNSHFHIGGGLSIGKHLGVGYGHRLLPPPYQYGHISQPYGHHYQPYAPNYQPYVPNYQPYAPNYQPYNPNPMYNAGPGSSHSQSSSQASSSSKGSGSSSSSQSSAHGYGK